MTSTESVGRKCCSQFVQSTCNTVSPLQSVVTALTEDPFDSQVQNKAYASIRNSVMAQMSRKGMNYYDAESIAQDTAHVVLEAAGNGQRLTVGFIRQTARNKCADLVKALAAKKRDSSAYVAEELVTHPKPIEHWEVLEKLSELPHYVNQVLLLRFFYGMTLTQVAVQTGLSISKVHRLEKAGLTQMKEMLAG